jgi:YidC/Oxa1 family membrane protein insertase
MEKRAVLAVVLSLVILIAYHAWVAWQYGTPPPPMPEEKGEAKRSPPSPTPKPQPKLKEEQIIAAPKMVKEIRVETDNYVAVFTSQGARLKSFTLKQYRTSVDEKSPPFEMVPAVPQVPYPLGVQLQGPNPLSDEALIYAAQGSDLKLTGDAKRTLRFQGQIPTGGTVTKEFTFTGSSYPIGLEISVDGVSGNTSPALLLSSGGNHKGPTQDAVFVGLSVLVGNKIKRAGIDDIKKGMEITGPVSWAGFDYTYFLFAVVPESATEQKLVVKEIGAALVMDIGNQTPAKSGEKGRYTLFIGPKELDILRSMEKGLERSIDFGYFGFVSIPLLYAMHFSHRFTASYGIDIILLTILIKLLMAPLTHKSFVSMRQMQKLQPQMERVKEKFKDDREKLNKEIMELYRRNKVNPLGGCLPMGLQFPVFIGLYNALRTPIELRHTSFMWIKDLSRPDWESLSTTVAGWELGIPVLTLLMGASMFVQQWMTPSAGDPNQRRMMLIMPVIFTVMFVTFPAGLTIYWLVNNLLSIAQQYLINRMDR